jgi:hypothetical protein
MVIIPDKLRSYACAFRRAQAYEQALTALPNQDEVTSADLATWANCGYQAAPVSGGLSVWLGRSFAKMPDYVGMRVTARIVLAGDMKSGRPHGTIGAQEGQNPARKRRRKVGQAGNDDVLGLQAERHHLITIPHGLSRCPTFFLAHQRDMPQVGPRFPLKAKCPENDIMAIDFGN